MITKEETRVGQIVRYTTQQNLYKIVEINDKGLVLEYYIFPKREQVNKVDIDSYSNKHTVHWKLPTELTIATLDIIFL